MFIATTMFAVSLALCTESLKTSQSFEHSHKYGLTQSLCSLRLRKTNRKQWQGEMTSAELCSLCHSSPQVIFPMSSSVSGSLNGARSLVWRTAPPVGCERPRSWLWSACTSCTCPEGAHLHSSSRATGERGCGTASGPPSACCEGTSCTGAHPPNPSLWCCDQNRLPGLEQNKPFSGGQKNTFSKRNVHGFSTGFLHEIKWGDNWDV